MYQIKRPERKCKRVNGYDRPMERAVSLAMLQTKTVGLCAVPSFDSRVLANLGWQQTERIGFDIGTGKDKGKGIFSKDSEGFALYKCGIHRATVRFSRLPDYVTTAPHEREELEFKVVDGANGKELHVVLPDWFYSEKATVQVKRPEPYLIEMNGKLTLDEVRKIHGLSELKPLPKWQSDMNEILHNGVEPHEVLHYLAQKIRGTK